MSNKEDKRKRSLEREENKKRDAYYKKKSNKKKKLKLRKAQAISREKRNYIRKKIRPYFDAFRSFKDRHLLFVLKDTDNMERVLLQKYDLGRGNTLLALPVINEDMINEYLDNTPKSNTESKEVADEENAALKGLVNYYYSVIPGEVRDLPQGNMTVFRNCMVTGAKDNLVAVNIRPYDLNTWYNEEATSIGGFKVYQGNKLRTFMKYNEDLGKTYVYHDTLMELLLYKSMMGKINYQHMLEDHSVLAKRGNFGAILYPVLATDEEELRKRFKNEGKEHQELEEER